MSFSPEQRERGGPTWSRREALGLLLGARPASPPVAPEPPRSRRPVAARQELLVALAFGSLAVAAFAGCGARRSATRHPTSPSSRAPTVVATEATAPTGSPTAPSPAATAPRPIPAGARPIHLTLYHLAAEPCPDAPQVPMPRCGGGSIAQVSVGFRKSAAMQGTSQLCDGRVIGVQKVDPLCFVVVDAQYPWGMTSSGRAATPFRSIAVDPKTFAMGRWYYVPQLDGVLLPAPLEGKRHDGCVRADDTGGDVHGADVDLFVGPKAAMVPFVALTGGPVTMAPGDGVCAGSAEF